jgi:hypothetical protein
MFFLLFLATDSSAVSAIFLQVHIFVISAYGVMEIYYTCSQWALGAGSS